MIPKNELDTKLKSFQCQRCNECCKQSGFVYLTPHEADQIAQYLELGIHEFMDEYCELKDRRQIVLKKKANEWCIFLDEQKGCQIHSVKPKQCKDFPIQWRTARSFFYCEGMKKILD